MKKVFKYELNNNVNHVQCQKNAKVLTAAYQNDTLCIWVEVDTEELPGYKTVYVFATGEKIPNDIEIEYINICFVSNGLVFHVYEDVNHRA